VIEDRPCARPDAPDDRRSSRAHDVSGSSTTLPSCRTARTSLRLDSDLARHDGGIPSIDLRASPKFDDALTPLPSTNTSDP
jgi:hypothetical protein